MWHQEAHNSTAIEGNTLVRHEVEKLLEEGRAVGAKPLRDYMDVKGYGNAAHWVYGQALEPGEWQTGRLVSLQEIRQVHYAAISLVWAVDPHPHATDAEGPGNFRQHEIATFPEGMKPPTWTLADLLMSDWIAETDRLRDSSDEPLPERLTRLHNPPSTNDPDDYAEAYGQQYLIRKKNRYDHCNHGPNGLACPVGVARRTSTAR